MADLVSLSDRNGLIWYLQQQRNDRRDRKPLNTVAPVASGLLTIGSTLSCTSGTWIGGAPHTFTYQWYRNGSAIGGATSANYVTTLAGTHYCIVTCATIGKATQTAQSNNRVVA